MDQNYSIRWLDIQDLAIQAIYAARCLSNRCIADSSAVNYAVTINFKMPMRSAGASDLMSRQYGAIFRGNDSPITNQKYEGLAGKENPMVITLSRLSNLMRDSDYDESFLPPSQDAFSFAKRLLEECRGRSPLNITDASPAPIGDGGILIEWEQSGSCIRLIVPPDPKQAYIYLRKGTERKALKSVTGDTLIDLLSSLLLDEENAKAE